MRVELVPATIGHALLVVRGLRAAARSHFSSHDETRRALCLNVQRANFARAVMIDGRCVGVGGEYGPLLEPVGTVWAAGTIAGLRHRFLIARLAKREIAKLLDRRDELCCTLLEGDTVSIRFAEFLGFTVGSVWDWDGTPVRTGTIVRAVARKVAA